MIRTLSPVSRGLMAHARMDLAQAIGMCQGKQALSRSALHALLCTLRRDLEAIESMLLDEQHGWSDDNGERWSWEDRITLGPAAEDYR